MTARHLILVGLPGAGKTTVGRLVAEDLGWPFVDVDALIEERVGSSPPAIFADRGEAEFRKLERRSIGELIAEDRCQVIAPGGGWAAQAGALESVAERAFTVYLQTDPHVAAARTEESHHRPLLDVDGAGRETRMRELYWQRERSYDRCDAVVETDERTAAEVARKVAELARSQVG